MTRSSWVTWRNGGKPVP